MVCNALLPRKFLTETAKAFLNDTEAKEAVSNSLKTSQLQGMDKWDGVFSPGEMVDISSNTVQHYSGFIVPGEFQSMAVGLSPPPSPCPAANPQAALCRLTVI